MGCATCAGSTEVDLPLQVPSVANFVTENMFIVYAMDGCVQCHKVIELMKLTNQQFVVYNVGQHFTVEEFEAEFDSKTFPQVVVDLKGQNERVKIGGAAETAQYFKENIFA